MGFLRAPAPFRTVDLTAPAATTAVLPNGAAQYLSMQQGALNPAPIAWPTPSPVTSMRAAAAGMSLGHLVLVVFEAVMEVVCVSLPGYIIARLGHFDAEKQKFIANLNVMLFTPCLVFTKLASQLNAKNISELAIIPVIFIIMTAVSWGCGRLISKVFRFRKRQTNFVTAMSTLTGLHWDRIPNDTDDEVAARGILYLLIFQQLGQLLRWSWGYRVLLAPKEFHVGSESEGLEAGHEPYSDNPNWSHESTIINDSIDDDGRNTATSSQGSRFPSGVQTPVVSHRISFSKFVGASGGDNDNSRPSTAATTEETSSLVPHGTAFVSRPDSCRVITRFPSVESHLPTQREQTRAEQVRLWLSSTCSGFCDWMKTRCAFAFEKLPTPIQTGTRVVCSGIKRFLIGFWDFMNPPLWSMGVAILVASFPSLQNILFTPGTFVNNSVTRAVEQTGGVAVPLILVVLGANLARNTLPELEPGDYEHPKEETNLIIASLLGRMLLPTLITAPIIALMAKFLPISILDDPIFVVVCYLLTGAPSALQLAQICQINNVYMGAMARLLFQSYIKTSKQS
ncbi:hypothetical protein KEM54_003874 [Ascosphaera aggregata]|nr:hypothetical protein KEM54_003874 [Ascosphaera aggregata]